MIVPRVPARGFEWSREAAQALSQPMPTRCNAKSLEFEGHGSRRLVAKKLIFLLVFLRGPSWSFVSLRGSSF